MNQALKFVLLIAVVGAWPGPTFAQSADEIVEKYLAALGGRNSLSKIQSRITTGTIAVSTPGGEFSGSVARYDKAPNKSRVLTKLDLSAVGAGEMTRDQRFDGASGIILDSLSGDSEIAGRQLDSLRSGYFPNVYLNYKDRGATVELLGKEKVGSRDAYVLQYTLKPGAPAKHYIDAESFLLIRSVTKISTAQAGEIEQTADFSDYRAVDDVKVPFQTKTSSPVQSLSITVSKVEQNAAVDDAMFSKPGADKK